MSLPQPEIRADAEAHYTGLLDGVLPDEALCLTAVRGATLDEALLRFDAVAVDRPLDLHTAGEASVAAFPDPLPLVVAWQQDGWVFLAENNGYRGSMPAVLARLSEGTVAASAYWNVDFDNAIGLAAGGVVHSYEFMGGEAPTEIAPYVAGLDFADADVMLGSALAYVERVCGVRLTADAVTRPHQVAVVVSEVEPSGTASWLAEVDLTGVGEDAVRDATAFLAAQACAATGLELAEALADPVAQARASYQRALELRLARSLPLDRTDPIAFLQADVARRNADTTAEREHEARAHAFGAVRQMRSDQPVEALGAAMFHACQADRPGWSALLQDLRAHLS